MVSRVVRYHALRGKDAAPLGSPTGRRMSYTGIRTRGQMEIRALADGLSLCLLDLPLQRP
jgi:hypothetical protein